METVVVHFRVQFCHFSCRDWGNAWETSGFLCTTQRGLKPSIFRNPGLRFTDTSANLSKENKNKETHLHKRPQEITLKGHDDINIIIDYEQQTCRSAGYTRLSIHCLGQTQISYLSDVIFEGLATMYVYIRITIFWDMTLCDVVVRYLRSKITGCLYFQVRKE